MATNSVTRRLKRIAKGEGLPLKPFMRNAAAPGMWIIDWPAPRHHSAVVGASLWLARKGLA